MYLVIYVVHVHLPYIFLAELIFFAAIYLTTAMANQNALTSHFASHVNFISLQLDIS